LALNAFVSFGPTVLRKQRKPQRRYPVIQYGNSRQPDTVVHRPSPRADGRPTECAVFGWRQSFGVVRAGADDARGVDAVWLVRERGGERGGGVVRAPSDSDRRASSAVDASVSTSIRRPQLSLCGCPRASFARFAAGVAALCTIFERCLCRRRRLRARGSAVCGGRPPAAAADGGVRSGPDRRRPPLPPPP
jgi:hypothetical protein